MKKNTLSVAVLFLSAIPALSGLSEPDNFQEPVVENDYQLPEYTVGEVLPPVPSKVVMPRIPRNLKAQEAIIVFRVSAQGRAYDLRPGGFAPSSDPRTLDSLMRSALRYWHFEPALDRQGNPVSIKVALPVRLIKSESRGDSSARLAYSPPTIFEGNQS